MAEGGEGKKISIKLLVDERSAQQTKRLIGELIRDFTKLNQVAGGMMGGGGAALGMSVGGKSVSDTRLISSASPGGPSKSTLSAALTDNAKALKGLANVSKDSMRVMSDGIKRAVDSQKRDIASLDSDLARLAKRYDSLGARQRAAMASGLSPEKARELYGSKGDSIIAEKAGLIGQRAKAVGTISELEAAGASMGGGGGGGGPGFFGRNFPMQNGRGQLFRPGFVGGMIAGGVLAGANEMQQQPFDFTSAQARSAQAIGTMGVATKNGDMRYLGALMQMRDNDKFKELLDVGSSKTSAGISGVGSGLWSRIKSLDPNVVGGGLRDINMLDSSMKEQLRKLVDQQIASDPDFQNKLGRVTGESGMRTSLMRRMGMGEQGLTKTLSAFGGVGNDIGEVSGAFESLRAGGRGFAHSNMGMALRAGRAGMDPGMGGLLSASSASGTAGAMGAGMMGTGLDPVAAERIGASIAAGIQNSGFGAVSGQGMLGAMTSVGLGRGSGADAFSAGLRGQAVGGIGSMMGGGGDGLGAGINILSATKLAGKDIYKANALSKLAGDPAALMAAMRGDLTPSMKAYGITASDAKSMFSEIQGRNLRSRFVPGLAGNTGMGGTMKRLMGSYGGDIGAMIGKEGTGRGGSTLDELGAGLSSIMPGTFSSPAMAREAVSILAGVGRGPRKGKGLGDASFGSTSLQMRSGILKAGEEDYQSALNDPNIKSIAGMSKAFKSLGDSIGNLGSLGTNADSAAQALANLTDAAVALSGKLQNKSETDVRALLSKKKMEADNKRTAGVAATKIENQNTARSMTSGNREYSTGHNL